MRRVVTCLAMVALFALGGCAGFPGKELPAPDQSISTDEFNGSDWGAVLFSVTSDLDAGSEVVNATIIMDKPDEDANFDEAFSMHDRNTGALVGSLGWTRHFDQVNGRLFAKKLPEGTYYIKGWFVENGTGAFIRPRYELDPLVFEVKRGEITYIGDFQFMLDTGDNLFGITITGGAWPEVIDSSTRDLQVVRKIYPLIETDKVENDIVDDTKWSFEYLNAKMNTLKSDTE